MKKLLGLISLMLMLVLTSCERKIQDVKTDSGVGKAKAEIKAGADGLTIEQRNIKKRVERDNAVGSIKHLYVISAYSGQVLIYSTVDGKVSSSGKKLNPKTVQGYYNDGNGVTIDNTVVISGRRYVTNEMIEDDGTFGSSIDYIYWFDQKGVYHQHYINGGQILHISDEPLSVKSVIINMEVSGKK